MVEVVFSKRTINSEYQNDSKYTFHPIFLISNMKRVFKLKCNKMMPEENMKL